MNLKFLRVLPVVAVLFLTVPPMSAADAPPKSRPWPKRANIKIEFTTTTLDKLQRGIRFDGVPFDVRGPHIGLCWLDLNGDGRAELLIDSHEGGTGGTFKLIFARTRSGFRRIASWLGSIKALPAANGYYQFENWSSGGGGEYSRALHRYERGRYRMVRLEDWRGTDTEAGFEFVRSRDPKEYDEE